MKVLGVKNPVNRKTAKSEVHIFKLETNKEI